MRIIRGATVGPSPPAGGVSTSSSLTVNPPPGAPPINKTILVRHETPEHLSAHYTVDSTGAWKYKRNEDVSTGTLPPGVNRRLQELVGSPALDEESALPEVGFCPHDQKHYSLGTLHVWFDSHCGGSDPRTPVFNEIVGIIEDSIPSR